MAGRAFLWGRLVEEHRLPFDFPPKLVAAFAAHVAVNSLQCEGRPLVMIEQGRLPLLAVVALGARCGGPLGKLFAVDVFVAVFALSRRRLEVHVGQARLHVGGLVAIDAGGCPVGSDQRERCPGMVETR